jgi:hypothetical protein
MFNAGLLGFAASFALGVMIQDSYFPPLGQKPISRLNSGRAAFWMTWVGGTFLSTVGGRVVGGHVDRWRAVQRVEEVRGAEEAAQAQAQP